MEAPLLAISEPSLRSRLLADIVAKVFLGWRSKIPKAADALHARRGEGPYRFIQNRSRVSVKALKSDAAIEWSEDQLGEIFWLVRFWTFATKSAPFGPNRVIGRSLLMEAERPLPMRPQTSENDPKRKSSKDQTSFQDARDRVLFE
jgi:hypothetical protein